MKILHIGSGNLYGGVEKVLLTLARQRDQCPALEQHFAVCFAGRLQEELRECGVPVHLLKAMRGREPMSIVNNRRKLARLRSEGGFDAVVFHSLWAYSLLALGAPSSVTRRVLWLHDAIGPFGPLEFLSRFQKPDLILSNSRYTAGTVGLLYPKTKVGVVYCPVELSRPHLDPARRQSIRESLGTCAEDVVLVQSSRMEAWKGHALHLNAVARLKDLPDWVLWFVGGAQRPEEQLYVEALKQQAATLGIASRVRFLGQRSDVPEVLRAADIHCQPNMGPEPFGVTFVEAMLAELPIAACRMGAAPELIDASCGLLCQPGNVAELASILRLLVTNRGLRERLGSNGPARARQLSDPGSRLRELYEFVSQAPEVGKRRSLGSTVCR